MADSPHGQGWTHSTEAPFRPSRSRLRTGALPPARAHPTERLGAPLRSARRCRVEASPLRVGQPLRISNWG
eukprot:5756797-Alexandrium_andersonii.AAC.1